MRTGLLQSSKLAALVTVLFCTSAIASKTTEDACSQTLKTLFFQRNLQECIKSADSILKENPKCLTAIVWRGKARAQREDYDEAVADLKDFINATPSCADASVYTALASCCLQLGRKDAAFDAVNRGLKNVKDPNLYRIKASIEAMDGKHEEAIADAGIALKAAPYDRTALLVRAREYEQVHLYDKALADYLVVVSFSESKRLFDGNYTTAVQRRIALLNKLGKTDLAKKESAKLKHDSADWVDSLLSK